MQTKTIPKPNIDKPKLKELDQLVATLDKLLQELKFETLSDLADSLKDGDHAPHVLRATRPPRGQKCWVCNRPMP